MIYIETPPYIQFIFDSVSVLLKVGTIATVLCVPTGILLKIKNRKTQKYPEKWFKILFIIGPAIITLGVLCLIIGIILFRYSLPPSSDYFQGKY